MLHCTHLIRLVGRRLTGRYYLGDAWVHVYAGFILFLEYGMLYYSYIFYDAFYYVLALSLILIKMFPFIVTTILHNSTPTSNQFILQISNHLCNSLFIIINKCNPPKSSFSTITEPFSLVNLGRRYAQTWGNNFQMMISYAYQCCCAWCKKYKVDW